MSNLLVMSGFNPEKLKKRRKEKGLTQEQIASLVGVHPVSYARWETGDREPKGKYLIKLSEVLGVPPSYFFESEESSSGELQYLGELDGFIELPVMGKVGAGDMIIPYPEGETYLVPLAGKRKPKPDWCVLKVEGKSMEPYIHDGSVLVVEPARFGYAEDGQIVILCEEGTDWTNGCTVKKIKDAGDKWLVIPLNEEYNAYLKPKSEVKIKGIVRKVIWEP
jgi:repressor LexA